MFFLRNSFEINWILSENKLMDDLLNALEFEYYTPFRIWKKLQCREYNTHAYANIPEDIKEFLCYFIDYRHVSYVAEYFNYFEIVLDLYIASEIKYNNSSIRSTIYLIEDRFTIEKDGVEFNLFHYPNTLHLYKPIQEYFSSKYSGGNLVRPPPRRPPTRYGYSIVVCVRLLKKKTSRLPSIF